MLYKRTKNNRRVFFNFTYLMLWVGSSMIRTCRRSRRCRIPLWIRWVLCSRRSLIWWLRRWRWWTARLLLGWTWIGTWILTMCWRIRWLTSGSICLQNKKKYCFQFICIFDNTEQLLFLRNIYWIHQLKKLELPIFYIKMVVTKNKLKGPIKQMKSSEILFAPHFFTKTN